jgi:hypothetical protein
VKTVYKYPVGFGCFACQLPIGAQVLHAAFQDGEAQMWALVDPAQELETRQFVCVWTGNRIVDIGTLSYVATLFEDGGLVYHLFEERA